MVDIPQNPILIIKAPILLRGTPQSAGAGAGAIFSGSVFLPFSRLEPVGGGDSLRFCSFSKPCIKPAQNPYKRTRIIVEPKRKDSVQ